MFITKHGIDKAYGIKKLKKVFDFDIIEMIFIGDTLMKGEMISCSKDRSSLYSGSWPEDTKRVIEGIAVKPLF